MEKENLNNINMCSSLEIQNPQTEEDTSSNSKKILIKIIICIIYFALIVTAEMFYRDPLFKKSIEMQEYIKDGRDKDDFFYKYWEFMSYFGEAKLTLSIFAIIFLFFPINSSFTIILVIS